MSSKIAIKDTGWKVRVSNWKDFFKSLTGLIISGVKLDPAAAAQSVVNTAVALGLADKEEKAFLLLTRTMVRAVTQLLSESDCSAFEEFAFTEELESLFDEKDFFIDAAFFGNPKGSPIVEEIQVILKGWLPYTGISASTIAAIIDRFPSYFVFALNDEWRSNQNSYASLRAFFETPFSKAEGMELDWQHYRARLDMQVNEGILGENFGLTHVYVPICACYDEKVEKSTERDMLREEKTPRTVIDLEAQVCAWIDAKKKEDAVRVISGGPGSGKSSFVKMLAANYSQKHAILLIPLHQLNLTTSFKTSIGEYLSETNAFMRNPLEQAERVLIILDGLDELTQQGKSYTEAARDFIDEMLRYTEARNTSETLVQVLLTGRVTVVQSVETKFREPGQILHALPYYLPEDEKKKYIDTAGLLAEDKRHEWWKKYGRWSGHGYEGLPKGLQRTNLDEITAQPLLNFLVAMSFERGSLLLTDETNLNEIYEDLISAVYARGYEKKRIHAGTSDLSEAEFVRMLEEIAVAAWQGAGRTATIQEIQEHCAQNNVRLPWEGFQKDAEAGVTKFLTAFYFRKTEQNQSGNETFEFTHKSFGEYLAAKRLVRQIALMEKKGREQDGSPDEGWNEGETLQKWLRLCGKVALDADILRFLRDEIQREYTKNKEAVSAWQKRLCKLISYMLRSGMPFEGISPRPAFQEEKRLSRNAEESLLAALSACAYATGALSEINWPTIFTAGNWFCALQKTDWSGDIALKCLNHLDLQNCFLLRQDFNRASLPYTNLARAILKDSNLMNANLSGANLSDADLFGADLFQAQIIDSNLSDADLGQTDLRRANFRNADFENANLSDAYAFETNFSGTNSIGANFSGADLLCADFMGANLLNATIDEDDDFEYIIDPDGIVRKKKGAQE